MATSHHVVLLALRARAATLSVCTTGSVTLAATTTGYTRTTGSFITDGFAPGMELTVAGFTSNPVDTLTRVEALTLTVATARTAEAGNSGRTLSVGLPGTCVYENLPPVTAPVVGKPYVVEQYLPGPRGQHVFGGTGGLVDGFPQYLVTFYVPFKTQALAAFSYADALLTLFPPRQSITLSTGEMLRVRTDTGSYRSQLRTDGDSWAWVTATIPLWLQTINTI